MFENLIEEFRQEDTSLTPIERFVVYATVLVLAAAFFGGLYGLLHYFG
jgi:hypothetical protein